MSVFLSSLCWVEEIQASTVFVALCVLFFLSLHLITYVCISAGPLWPITATPPLLAGLSLAAHLQLEAHEAATLAITPQKREHKHTHTQVHTQ